MANIKLKSTTTRNYSCTLSKEELIRILNNAPSALSHFLPPDTEMTVTVPSGGDFSGDNLDLDDGGGLTLTWREVKEDFDGR